MPLKYNPFTGKLDWVNTQYWEINDDDRLSPIDDVDVQLCCDLYVGGNVYSEEGLQFIAGGVDLYIATTGSDSTGDGSVSNPWATLTKLITEMARYRSNGTITGHLGDGTYSQTTEAEVPIYAAGDWALRGNIVSPTSVVIDGEDTNPSTGNVILRNENSAVNLSLSGINFKRAFVCVATSNSRTDYAYLQFDDYRYAINSDGNAINTAFSGTSTLTFNGYSGNGTIAIRLLNNAYWNSSCNLRFTKNRHDISFTNNCNVRLQQSVGSTFVSTLDATYGANSIIGSRLSSVEISIPMTLNGNSKGTYAISLDSMSRMYSYGTYTHSISNYSKAFYFGINCFVQEPVNSTWNFTSTTNEIVADPSAIIQSADNLDCTTTWIDPPSTVRGYDDRYYQIGNKLIPNKSVYTGTDTTDDVPLHICDSATAFTLTVTDGATDGEEIKIVNRGAGTVTLSGKISTTTATTTLISGETIVLNWDSSDDEWQ